MKRIKTDSSLILTIKKQYFGTVDLPLPYSVHSARHHFRNFLGVIRGFSEILKEGLPSESADFSHFEFIVESTDRIQKFIDRVLCSEEILKREEWQHPFWINIEHEMKSIIKTVNGLLILNQEDSRKMICDDLMKIKISADDVLVYTQDFIFHSVDRRKNDQIER